MQLNKYKIKKKILIFGASGMIGSTLVKVISMNKNLKVIGVIRQKSYKKLFSDQKLQFLIYNYSSIDLDSLKKILLTSNPDVVINCSGITKQRINNNNLQKIFFMNSIFPHRLAYFAKKINFKLIQISTDCVFSGKLLKGSYKENDVPDAEDTYGKTKFIGEVTGDNIVTLRTSTIGHELLTRKGLLEWFLSQKKKCYGFNNAVFSGITTQTLANIIAKIIIPKKVFSGLYHISAKPINKYELLCMIAKTYNKKIKILRFKNFRINRSLNSNLFKKKTGYIAPSWKFMISEMYKFNKKNYEK